MFRALGLILQGPFRRVGAQVWLLFLFLSFFLSIAIGVAVMVPGFCRMLLVTLAVKFHSCFWASFWMSHYNNDQVSDNLGRLIQRNSRMRSQLLGFLTALPAYPFVGG